MPTRRDVLERGLGAMALLTAASRPTRALDHFTRWIGAGRPHLATALEAARWIHRSRVVTEHGVTWPADPADAKSVTTELYHGMPGVVLFLLELYHTTGDRAYLADACAGADHLVATLPADDQDDIDCGLYSGSAGHAFVLERAYRVSGRRAYRDAALRAVRRIHARAKPAGAGVAWGDTTDIISGSAGIGLLLLHAARTLDGSDRPSLALATQAGKRLLELGEPQAVGTQWRMDPTFQRIMPNFSHGTAGVAYFLASLYGETHERAFLDAALAGAKHLQSIATTNDETCLIYHHDGDGKTLYYLGWCHGPVGTARLFYRLAQITRAAEWAQWVRRGARGIMLSGIPEQRTPGFWNNVSHCCGNTGVAQFFLDLQRAYGDPIYATFRERVVADLMRRSTVDGDGRKWIQAENRVQPAVVVAQTGFMQGAAGMGTMLLHLDAFERGARSVITFPDSPFV